MKKLIISCVAAAALPVALFGGVCYLANGGNGTMSSHYLPDDGYGNLMPNNFTRSGYVFVGWSCRDEDYPTSLTPPSYADQAAVTRHSFYYDALTDGSGHVYLDAEWGKEMFGTCIDELYEKGIKFYTGYSDGAGYWTEDSEGAIVSTNGAPWVAAVVRGPGVFSYKVVKPNANDFLSFYSYLGGEKPGCVLGSNYVFGKRIAEGEKEASCSVDIVLDGDCVLGWYGSTGVKLCDVTYAPQVEVTFDACGGTIYEASRLYFIDKTYESLPQAQQRGKAFLGWFTEQDGGKLITEESIVSKDVKQLYARWSDPVSEPEWNPVAKPDTVIVYARIYDKSLSAYLTGADGVLAAFSSSGECRGKATLSQGPNGKLFQLTIGVENSSETGLRFKYWSASTGILEIGEAINASAATIGSIAEPTTLYIGACGFVLSQGWTWVSVNVEPDDSSFSSVFRGVSFADNDVVKSSDGSATYYGGAWYPSPATFKIVPGRAYAVKKSTSGEATVTVSGTSATASLAVTAGWNWIGPMTGNPVSRDALKHSGGFTDNDVISSSSSSATYYGGTWYGSLLSLEPGVGYKAWFGKAGTLSDK